MYSPREAIQQKIKNVTIHLSEMDQKLKETISHLDKRKNLSESEKKGLNDLNVIQVYVEKFKKGLENELKEDKFDETNALRALSSLLEQMNHYDRRIKNVAALFQRPRLSSPSGIIFKFSQQFSGENPVAINMNQIKNFGNKILEELKKHAKSFKPRSRL